MIFSQLRCMGSSTSMDTLPFKLCYRWSTLLLVVFSFVVTCRLLIGNSFECIANEDALPPSYVNSKCYEKTVYTLPTKSVAKGNPSFNPDPSHEDFRRYQSYYPWVNLLFLVHAFNFYLPHLLWRWYEKGYMQRLTARLQKFPDSEGQRRPELRYLAEYVVNTMGSHRFYAAMYIFLEVCNFAISLAQTLWLVNFFDVTGVPDFLPYVIETWSEFQSFYFPSEGFCELSNITASDLMPDVRFKVLCHLPLNALHMKMFLFLYAWYILVTVMCGLSLLFRISLLFSRFVKFAALGSSLLTRRSIMRVVVSTSYSDWFFLSALRKSMLDIDFAHMMEDIAGAISSLRDEATKDLEDWESPI